MDRYEWAHASVGPQLVRPAVLRELADDGNPDGDWGLAWSTGSDGCMVFGSLDDLQSLATRITRMVAAVR